MYFVKIVVFLTILGLLFCSSISQAGKLDQVRDAVHNHDDQESSSCDSDSDDYYNDTFDEEYNADDGNVVFDYLPNQLPPTYFLSRPYALGHPGHVFRLRPITVSETPGVVAVSDPRAEVFAEQDLLSDTSVRLATEYALDLDGVHRPSLLVSFDSVYIFGFSTQWTHYVERLSAGQYDQLTIGDFNITFKVIQSQALQLRTGIGARMISDGQLAFGFNFNCALDLFIKDPYVISVVGDIGNLDQALYLHVRATVGAMLGCFEPYLGYDLVLIGSDAAIVWFQGPLLGIRLWV
jgi:hypothetical protein